MRRKVKLISILGAVLVLSFWFYWILPKPLFSSNYSTVIESSEGSVLAAKIAADEQWRFPVSDSVPYRFKQCITQFEDAYYYYHLGVNPISILKAGLQNIQAGRIVRGGSTLSMQVIRMALQNPPRTFWQKLKEMVLAVRLELGYSKEEILKLYAAHAPFGGNIVGLEAASWRYFGRASHTLSWSEAATLAVLPNAPSLIRPGKSPQALLEKRNRLLKKLLQTNIIDTLSYQLAIAEPLPAKAQAIPRFAPHLLNWAVEEGKQGKRVKTTVQSRLQKRVNTIISRFQDRYAKNNIRHVAAMITEVKTGRVVAYVGNGLDATPKQGQQVDIIQAPRSSGSILKPLLFAAALEDGLLLPNALIPDIPTQINGYAPRNFNESYQGAVTASNALTQSLNIPFVRLLQQYGVPKFLNILNRLNFPTINNSADHYGLSLILGGAEITLWDISKAYVRLGQKLEGLQHYKPHVFNDTPKEGLVTELPLSRASLWYTVKAMSALNRPREENGWTYYQGQRKIAWKTGTSFGFRDAWAVGITPEYAVAVWVGNANGEGRSGLTGASKAGPVLFQIFDVLPETTFFDKPYQEFSYAKVCKKSGWLAGPYCPVYTLLVSRNAERATNCRFHKKIFLTPNLRNRVHRACYVQEQPISQQRFVLPANWAYYYKNKHPEYTSLPPWLAGCNPADKPIRMIYPNPGATLFLPKTAQAAEKIAVFQAAHEEPSVEIFWHLDDTYIGSTLREHRMNITAGAGKHVITLQDALGNDLSVPFTVTEK